MNKSKKCLKYIYIYIINIMTKISFTEYMLYCIYNKLNNKVNNNIFNDLLYNALNNGWNIRKVNNKIIIQKNRKKII
jgi:hypothetical protein